MGILGRNWASIIYPESVNDEYLTILQKLHTPFAISPLHTPDEEHLKAHYHLLVTFSGKKSFDNVNEICKSINSTRPVKVENLRGYTRYLIHKDNPEKQQFDSIEDISCYCGFDCSLAFSESEIERRNSLSYIFNYCNEHGITTFSVLVNSLIVDNKLDLLQLVSERYSHFFDAYFRSIYYTERE